MLTREISRGEYRPESTACQKGTACLEQPSTWPCPQPCGLTPRSRGAFFTYGDTKLGQGRENAKEFLKQHPEASDRVEQEIRKHAEETTGMMRLGKIGTTVEVESDMSEDEE